MPLFLETSVPMEPIHYWKPLVGVTGYPGGGRRNGQTGGEILPAHIYQNEEKRMCGLLSGFILFRLVASTLQPRVVGPYPV
jgi:hypothetical protein